MLPLPHAERRALKKNPKTFLLAFLCFSRVAIKIIFVCESKKIACERRKERDLKSQKFLHSRCRRRRRLLTVSTRALPSVELGKFRIIRLFFSTPNLKLYLQSFPQLFRSSNSNKFSLHSFASALFSAIRTERLRSSFKAGTRTER